MKFKISLSFLILATFNLFADPYRVNRLYHPERNVCIDLISDVHRENALFMVGILGIHSITNPVEKSADLFIRLYKHLNGNMKFIWECSELEANVIKGDWDEYQRLVIKSFEFFTQKTVPILPVESELAATRLGLKGAAYSDFVRIYNTLAKKTNPGFKRHEYALAILYPNSPMVASFGLNLEKPWIDALKEVQNIPMEQMPHLLQLAKEIRQNTAANDFICSDNTRDNFISIKEGVSRIVQYNAIAPTMPLQYVKEIYSIWRDACKLMLVRILVSLQAIISSETELDRMKQIIGKQLIGSTTFSNRLDDYKQNLVKKMNHKILGSVSNFFSEDNDPNKNMQNLVEIIQSLIKPIFATLDLEIMGNILSCNANRMVVYAGGGHCQELCKMLKQQGFLNIADIGDKSQLNLKETLIFGALKSLEMDQLEQILFEDPKETLSKFQSQQAE